MSKHAGSSRQRRILPKTSAFTTLRRTSEPRGIARRHSTRKLDCEISTIRPCTGGNLAEPAGLMTAGASASYRSSRGLRKKDRILAGFMMEFGAPACVPFWWSPKRRRMFHERFACGMARESWRAGNPTAEWLVSSDGTTSGITLRPGDAMRGWAACLALPQGVKIEEHFESNGPD
jgi:hypothetical protein